MNATLRAARELACAILAIWGLLLVGGFLTGALANACYVAFRAGWRF